MNIKSYAKINICLNIVGTNKENYHLLDMVNLPLDIYDVLSIDINDNGRSYSCVNVTNYEQLIACKDNICYKAIQLLRKKFGFTHSITVTISKNIPIGAGMGGGSSNAAHLIKYINEYLKLNISSTDMKEFCLRLGADCPYFIESKPARVSGIGEIVESFELKTEYYCIILKGSIGLNTKEVYDTYDEVSGNNGNIQGTIESLVEGNEEELSNNIENALVRSATMMLPEIKDHIEVLKQEGLKVVGMTGSGSSVFGITKDKKLAKKVYINLRKNNINSMLTKIHRKDSLWKKLMQLF